MPVHRSILFTVILMLSPALALAQQPMNMHVTDDGMAVGITETGVYRVVDGKKKFSEPPHRPEKIITGESAAWGLAKDGVVLFTRDDIRWFSFPDSIPFNVYPYSNNAAYVWIAKGGNHRDRKIYSIGPDGAKLVFR